MRPPANRTDSTWRSFPSWKIATVVESPPMSTSAQPSSFSSLVSTASDAASGSSTSSPTV